MPAAFVPMRLATRVLPLDPDKTRPLPQLPEITFATAPESPERLSPIRLPDEAAETNTPSPRLPAAAPS